MEEILTYSDLFGGIMPDFEEEIKKHNLYKLISIICEFARVKNSNIILNFGTAEIKINYEIILKMILLDLNLNDQKSIDKSGYRDILFSKKKHIISSQHLMILLKNAIYYCTNEELNDENFNISRDDYKEVLKLQLLLNERLDNLIDKDVSFDADHFIYCNYQINNGYTISFAFSRSYYIFEKLLKNKDNFDQKTQGGFKDYYKDFIKNYEYTPIEYLSVLFTELFHYTTNEYLINQSAFLDINDVCKGTALNSVAKKVIKDLSQPVSSYRKWAKRSIDNIWDFKGFLDFPYIKTKLNKCIMINDYIIKNCFFEKLYWQLRKCYSKDDNYCMDFYGRAYEKYIQELTKATLFNRKEIDFIDEFTLYNGDKSSDAYLVNNNKLIAIECKGRSVLLNTIIDNFDNDKNLDKLFISPVLQADNCFFNGKKEDNPKFKNIDKLYIISVTMSNINAIPCAIEKGVTEINKNKKSNEIECFFNMNIEEYERFMLLVEEDFDPYLILEEYKFVQMKIPFINFISSKYNSCHRKMPSFIKKNYDEGVQLMGQKFGFTK